MKKLVLISLSVAFFSVLLVSCKKDRVCECTYPGGTEKVTFNDATKRQAKDACVSTSYDAGNGTVVKIECELK
jgi:major membrane immunogen (membrane-anchored lipoprotein)